MKNRAHFSGPWHARELKDSPFKSTWLSPLKLIPLPRQIISRGDKFLVFYAYHLMYSEEKFYGHIADMVYLAGGDRVTLEMFLKVNRIQMYPYSDYRFLKKIGSGAFGIVFLAEHVKTGQFVAVKRVFATIISNDPHQYVSYEVEKETLLNVVSPHVIKLLATFQTFGQKTSGIWYVFEFVGGGTLSDIIINNLNIGQRRFIRNSASFAMQLYGSELSVEKRKQLNPYFMKTIKYYISQLLAGVVHLHELNIIHKDIKPENCLITSKGILKISDLGLAAKYRWFYYSARSEFMLNSLSNIPLEDNDMFMGGTVLYMEPEQRALFDDTHEKLFRPSFPLLSFQMDYFSVALIIFHMLFGFIYGDVECYSFLPCYSLLTRFILMHFFARDYLNYLKNVITKDIRESFRMTLVYNLRDYIKSDEDGLIPFLINGLEFRSQRWNGFCDRVKLKRFDKKFIDYILNIEKIKKKVHFFSGVNFDNLQVDPGLSVDKLLRKRLEIDTSVEIPQNKVLDGHDREYVQAFNIPYFNFQIPETQPAPWENEFDCMKNPHVDEITCKLFGSSNNSCRIKCHRLTLFKRYVKEKSLWNYSHFNYYNEIQRDKNYEISEYRFNTHHTSSASYIDNISDIKNLFRINKQNQMTSHSRSIDEEKNLENQYKYCHTTENVKHFANIDMLQNEVVDVLCEEKKNIS